MDVSVFDFKEEIGEKIGDSSRNNEGEEESNKDQKRDAFAGARFETVDHG